MKTLRLAAIMSAIFVSLLCSAQIDKITGRWVTIDDRAHVEASIVKIYKATNGKYYGRVEKILIKGYENMTCEKCKGSLKGKKVAGMVILYDMEYIDGKLQKGYVIDPENGRTYYGKIWYDPKSKHLILRGSLDKKGILGRNQEWIRAK